MSQKVDTIAVRPPRADQAATVMGEIKEQGSRLIIELDPFFAAKTREDLKTLIRAFLCSEPVTTVLHDDFARHLQGHNFEYSEPVKIAVSAVKLDKRNQEVIHVTKKTQFVFEFSKNLDDSFKALLTHLPDLGAGCAKAVWNQNCHKLQVVILWAVRLNSATASAVTRELQAALEKKKAEQLIVVPN